MPAFSEPLGFAIAAPYMLDLLVELDELVWPKGMAASREMFMHRMQVHPHGNYVAYDRAKKKIVGSVWTLLVEDRPFRTWHEATGGGLYVGAHDPFGEVLFGANISALKGYSECPIGPFMLDKVAAVVAATGKRYARMGGRIPGFRAWSTLFTAEDYICLYRGTDGRIYYSDPKQQGRYRCGPPLKELTEARQSRSASLIRPALDWALKDPPIRRIPPFDPGLANFTWALETPNVKIVRVLDDYFPDEDSLNKGVLIEWENPHWAGA